MHRSRCVTAALVVLFALLALPACGSDDGGGSGSGENRTVLVDYNHDEFASAFLSYFPKSLSVHPGDTITFKQAWTGEPHSVTLGTLTDGLMREVLPILEKYPEVESYEALKEVDPAAAQIYERVCLDGGKIEANPEQYCPALPDMATYGGPDVIKMNQNGAQPCYLDTGAPPTDKDKACPKREQPAFNGRQTFYNSGYIHYEGDQGNTFKMTLSEDIEPGNYQYYCNLHSPFAMAGAIEVKPKSVSVPSQSAVDRQARKEIDRQAAPLLKSFNDAKAGKATLGGKPFKGNLAGYGIDDEEHEIPAFISEFIPNPIKAKVGEKVTWYVEGHTVSFDVPRYFPIATVAKDGTVTMNPRAVKAVNSPVAEPAEGPPDGPPEPADVDAGEWDGRGFISSGVPDGPINWSLTFTKAGKYKYACLIHPRMVGEVDVSS